MGFAIMCSGGDAAGMNPAIKRFVEYVDELGYQPWLIYDGLEGLIDDRIEKAKFSDISGIIHRGGTVIRTSRSKRFFEYEWRKVAYDNLMRKGINKLVVLGGDGSFRALNQFYHDFDIPFAGVPSTIDNDIYGTEYCLGVDTALNVIRTSIDEIRDTAYSFKRAFVVEVMGRDCGYLALISALTSGAEALLIPELDYDLVAMEERFRRQLHEGRGYFIAVVAEGVKKSHEMVELFERIGVESRLTVLGHIQRGGSPTITDRLMAFEFTTAAVDALVAGHVNSVVVYRNGVYDYVTIEEINAQKYQIDPDLLALGAKLTR